jgi:hypothetical protein
MTVANAVQWLTVVTDKQPEDILGLGLSEQQLTNLAWMLHDNPRVKLLFNPGSSVAGVKLHRFVCQCGCGQFVEREYRTRRPRYKNNAHRDRAKYRRSTRRVL